MRKTLSDPPDGRARHDWRTVKRLLPYLWPRDSLELRGRVVLSIILLVLAKVATVGVPIFYKRAVDALTVDGTVADALVAVPVFLLVGYGTLRVLQQAFAELQGMVFTKVAERATRRVGLKTFRHLHALSLRFHLDRQTGGLSRIMERGTRAIDVLLRLALFRTGPQILELLFVCGVLWSLYDWRFAAVTLATVGGYILYTVVVTEWRMKYRRAMNDSDTDANTKAVDSLINYETVKYFGNERHEADRYDAALERLERTSVHAKNSLAALNIGQGIIVAAGLVVMMMMAADGVAAGTMTVGDFVLVNSYLIQLSLPLNLLGMVYREIKQALTDMESMFGLLDAPAEVTDRPNAPPLAIAGGTVTFEDVHFGYNPDRDILQGISFTIPAGRKVAVVGHSGAGKSTLARLLYRFYDPTAGRIAIDGQDIAGVTQDSLRAAIGVVPQDTVLFNDTIGYNIAYGRPGCPPEAVEEAARAAAIHDFVVALPQGYDTRVGERGLKLSGGEKQRVAIARTILKNPAILILDEATSALDTHTERAIQDSLNRVSANRTTLVIAHRLSTVIDADEILVMDAGRIVERGRHEALLSAGGPYAEMWRRQQESARLADRLAAMDADDRAEAEVLAEGAGNRP
ncbi:Lipid A export ATP-binding/permease protein MsbA [Caenispirillum salinarum AK4]|uniref:Lipid A export ATP-binding/permease protein MsbA n=1 Tax=Caenispirillum salinarum AK4 TaxID=1238182 RepID=K9GTZ3_9PROT|nr:ABC transporter ATP-binding protein/permease [Caenispirillum salinarum]EKV28617.1 Lipid A export ATP-binding/permease protein MsbA [Caenispirillum salinarum AK4]